MSVARYPLMVAFSLGGVDRFVANEMASRGYMPLVLDPVNPPPRAKGTLTAHPDPYSPEDTLVLARDIALAFGGLAGAFVCLEGDKRFPARTLSEVVSAHRVLARAVFDLLRADANSFYCLVTTEDLSRSPDADLLYRLVSELRTIGRLGTIGFPVLHAELGSSIVRDLASSSRPEAIAAEVASALWDFAVAQDPYATANGIFLDR